MKSILPIYKFPGETPLECITRFRVAFPEYKNVSITYAGRLDPMADGLLLLLAGDAVHEKDEWMHKDKTYIVTLLFGIATDSYDVLGRIKSTSSVGIHPSARGGPASGWQHLSTTLKNHIKTFQQPFPPYASFKVQGKPLFQWAKEGRLNEITIPSKTREIFSLELLNIYTKSSHELLNDIQERISQVHGDFRQDEVLHDWKTLLKENRDWQLATIRVHCSSGTYMRSLANTIGHELNSHAIAYHITRESLGDLQLQSSVTI